MPNRPARLFARRFKRLRYSTRGPKFGKIVRNRRDRFRPKRRFERPLVNPNWQVDVQRANHVPNVDNYIDLNDTEALLVGQLENHIRQMIAAVGRNGDAQERMQSFHDNGAVVTVTVAKINPNGNCLLASIVHQIHRMPIDSEAHKAATAQLRRDIVAHILNNFESYSMVLQGAVLDKEEKEGVVEIGVGLEQRALNFLLNTLSKDGEWGGQECIIAASRIFEVNIITFDEAGKYYLNNTNIYDRTIAIAYRVAGERNGQIIRNHYDSVCKISAKDIIEVARLVFSRL